MTYVFIYYYNVFTICCGPLIKNGRGNRLILVIVILIGFTSLFQYSYGYVEIGETPYSNFEYLQTLSITRPTILDY